MLFKTLLSSLQSLSKHEIIIAQDISPSGQKTFQKNTLEPLKQLYETCADKHWYECLIENRPSKIFLDVESTEAVDLQYILTKLAEAVQLKFHIQPDIKVLDSCSDEKQSWHVICNNIYLKNVYHVGAFIRRFVLCLQGHPCEKPLIPQSTREIECLESKGRVNSVQPVF